MKKMKIKGSELKQLVSEELAKLQEATPGTMGTPSMGTDHIGDFPEGEAPWQQIAGQGADADTGKTYSWRGSDNTKGASHALQHRAGIGPADMEDWSQKNPGQHTVAGRTFTALDSHNKTGTGVKPTSTQSQLHTNKFGSYSPENVEVGQIINPNMRDFGAGPVPEYGSLTSMQNTVGDYNKPGGIQTGDQLEYAPGKTTTAPEAGNFQAWAKFQRKPSARQNYRSAQRFNQGLDIAGNQMQETTQIKGSELKQIVQEELTKLLSEGDNPWGPYDADADEWYEYRHMADQDMWHQPAHSGHLVSPGGDTPEDIAKQMIESGVSVTDETASDAALNAGVLDDDLPDFVDAIVMSAEELQPQGNF